MSAVRADAVRNRQRILDAASELVERAGTGVPLDEIARHASVGPGTVHRHFPSKESLFAALAVERMRAVITRLQALVDAADPAAALIEALTAMLGEGERSSALKAALAGTDVDLRRAAPDAAADLRSLLDILLRRAQRVGAIRTDLDTDDLLALLAGAFAALRHANADRDRAARISSVVFAGLQS